MQEEQQNIEPQFGEANNQKDDATQTLGRMQDLSSKNVQ